jgi:lipid II:glycine glycyltransferase (peptidoglycan interpeptide bridge formation enzyme)
MPPSPTLSTHVEAPGHEWDQFLLRTPGGHHIQSALWAEVKSATSWKPLRVVVRHEGTIVAGIQTLLRRIGLWHVAYAGGGPVFGTEDPEVRRLLLDRLLKEARKRRVLYMVVQPVREDPEFSVRLTKAGFWRSGAELISKATILLDITKSEEELLADLRKRHRSRIRHASREGVKVFECGPADLPTVYSLMQDRAQRKGFPVDSLQTFQGLWNVMQPGGHMHVTLAEADGEISATLIALGWGDTVYWKRGGWNGKHGHLGVNEAQHWESILWAKHQGYRRVDLEGIDYECAREVLFGEKASYDISKSPNFFKLGFGGSLVLNPEAREYVFPPLLRYAYHVLFPRIRSSRLLRWLIDRLRGTA